MADAVALTGTQACKPMVDPQLDDMTKPWGYEPRSSVWIGLPFQPKWTTVTYDGAVYSPGNAELCFFYGPALKPLLALQKNYLDGWIPVVQHRWHEDAIAYDIEIFAAKLDGEDESNTLNFVQVRMRNTSSEPVKAHFAAAIRLTGGAQRWGGIMGPHTHFDPDWSYEMTGDSVIRDGKLVYTFTATARPEALIGAPYERPFVGSERGVTHQTPVCLARYEVTLAPGKTKTLVFKMPRMPVPLSMTDYINKIRAARYASYRAATMKYWKDLLASGMSAEIPEARVHQAFRANMVHMLLAARTIPAEKGNAFPCIEQWPIPRGFRTERIPTSGLYYPGFFGNDFVDTRLAYDVLGHGDVNEFFIDALIRRYLDESTIPKGKISYGWQMWAQHGQVIQSIAHHYLITRDRKYARKVLPKLRLAINVLKKAVKKDPYGLHPEVGPYDAEMIQGHYTSHNLWSLLGLRSAVRFAREIGAKKDEKAWRKVHDRLCDAFMKGLKASVGKDGYVPTGLYKFVVGKKTRADVAPEIFNNEWENCMLAWPAEALAPSDPRVAATLEKLHRCDYREGVLGYRNAGGDLHGYSGYSAVYQLIARGEQAQALTDLYYLLLHCGSNHEVWEQGVFAWSNRESNMATCHAWAAARNVLAVRNMLAMEMGGRAGLDENQRDLHLFSVVSPIWAGPGKELSFKNALTEMGKVSAAMKFRKDGADVTIRTDFHHPPRSLVVHVPYFVNLQKFKSDAKTAKREGDHIVLSPDARRLTLTWRAKPGTPDGTFQRLLTALRQEPTVRIENEKIVYVPAKGGPLTQEEAQTPAQPLSFETVLRVYRHEYARRYAEYLKAGGKPVPIEAPVLAKGSQH